MEERQWLVELYQGWQSDFGNFYIANCGKNTTSASCYRMAVFGMTQHVLHGSWVILIGHHDSGCYWHRAITHILSPAQVWGDAVCSRCHKAIHPESFRTGRYVWWNPVTMWLCIGVIQFLSDKMWILNRIKLWKIRKNLSRVVAHLSLPLIINAECLYICTNSQNYQIWLVWSPNWYHSWIHIKK